MSEEFKKSLDASLAEASNGKTHTVSSVEELIQMVEIQTMQDSK